jgi:hypothetical protein
MTEMLYEYLIDAPANGRVRTATITVVDESGSIIHTDKADMTSETARQRLVNRLAEKLGKDRNVVQESIEKVWFESLNKHKAQQAERDAARESASDQITVEILDSSPVIIRRPLCLVGSRAYAAAWLYVQTTKTKEVNRETGEVTTFDPPQVHREPQFIIVRDDGQVFSDELAGTKCLSELGMEVRLSHEPLAARTWSGAGVKRFLAGERPLPATLFSQVKGVAGRFMDFNRSLATQEQMCELIACYVIATYLLDAFNVAGYLWPNGDKGAGKTNLLIVVTEMAYLGTLVLGGGSYASLRDLADYGATLAFDDAEGIMDTRKADPDKRALLLAGNRRGATVTVKELVGEEWKTRHIDTYCFRLFSAIRLPDEVLASRTITTPLLRSVDRDKANADPMDHSLWPFDRRRLVDDLWALGLTGLREVQEHEAAAVSAAKLAGRDLQPWRAILAVAHWLQDRHGVTGLFDRMSKLSVDYQQERGEMEENDPVRIAIKGLYKLLGSAEDVILAPKSLAIAMHEIAVDDGLAEPEVDKKFISAQRVGWLLKRLRVRKAERTEKTKQWQITRAELDALARAYGMAPAAPPDEGSMPDDDHVSF